MSSINTGSHGNSHDVIPITKKSVKTTRKYPQLYRGNVFASNGLFYTDREYARFLKKAKKIKLK